MKDPVRWCPRCDRIVRIVRAVSYCKCGGGHMPRCAYCGLPEAETEDAELERRIARDEPVCDGTYVDFQGAQRQCLPGGEGCTLPGCVGTQPPSGGW